MTHTNLGRDRKSALERDILKRFKEAYQAFPSGTIRHGDKPDTIVESERMIGIEITGLYLIDGGDDKNERIQSMVRDRVVEESYSLYVDGRVSPNYFVFGFDYISKKRRKLLPKELCDFAVRIDGKVRRNINVRHEGGPSELTFAWNGGPLHQTKWRTANVFSVDFMRKERLEAVIRDKERKSVEYQKCDSCWLLIFVDSFDRAQEQIIEIPDPYVHSDIFDKIFVFETHSRHIVEVHKAREEKAKS